jgi:hypothetical protein
MILNIYRTVMMMTGTINIKPNHRELTTTEQEDVDEQFRELPRALRFKSDMVAAILKDGTVFINICRYYRSRLCITPEEHELLKDKIVEIKPNAVFVEFNCRTH